MVVTKSSYVWKPRPWCKYAVGTQCLQGPVTVVTELLRFRERQMRGAIWGWREIQIIPWDWRWGKPKREGRKSEHQLKQAD